MKNLIMDKSTKSQILRRLQSFNLTELRLIAKSLKLKVPSSKTEIMEKIGDHLSTEKGKQQAKVDLNKYRFNQIYSTDSTEALFHQEKSREPLPPPPSNHPPVGPEGIRCLCNRSEPTNLLGCTGKCSFKQHKHCLHSMRDMPKYECPLCQLSKIDPLCPVLEVLQSAIRGDSLDNLGIFAQSRNRWTKNFIINQTYYSKLKSLQNNLSLQVRCLKLDKDGCFEHCWPLKGFFYVNGSMVQEFRMPESNVAAKRKDRPCFINNYRSGTNTYEFVHEMVKNEGHYAYVFLFVEKLNVGELFGRWERGMRRGIEECRQFVVDLAKHRYANMEDTECMLIEPKQVKVNYKCPFSFKMITTPARGLRCKHIQVSIHIL